MAKAKSSGPRRAGEAPDMAELSAAWSACVNHRNSNFWARQKLNWESRYCVWPNQSPDGRKWPKNPKHKVWPWPGSADSRVHLVDKYVNEDVALLMQAFTTQRILVKPNDPSRDAAWANRVTGLLRWQIYEEMEETADEAELLANFLLQNGCAAMGIWWHREESYTRQTITMEALMQAAAQAQQRLARGERGDALQFQADLPLLIADPALTDQAAQALLAMTAQNAALTEERLGKALKELRENGTAHYPVPIVNKDRPCLRALAWNEDIWTPPEATDLQRSRQVFTRELLTDADVQARARQYGWDEDYVDEWLEKHKGSSTTTLTTYNGARSGQLNTGRFNGLLVPDDSNLYECITAYERLLDEDGIPGIWVTTFTPGMTAGKAEGRKSKSESFAASELLDYAHGQYPFAVFARERRSRSIEDARGYGEIASTWQNQIKKQQDSRIDRTDVATLPPSHHPPGEEPDAWGPGVQIPTMQPERYGYFEIPRFDQGSQEVENTTRLFADEYFGRETPERNPTNARLLRGELVRKWLAGWKRTFTHIMQLNQQYLPDEVFYRVVGGEQGRGMRATREEIQGPFNISLTFNVDDTDRELVKEKLELINAALQVDALGIVDRAEAVKVTFELIDPNYGERLIRPAESAAMQEITDEQNVLAKLLNGIQVDVQGNEAFAVRKQALMQMIQQNPTAQEKIGSDENVRGAVERRVKQLDFNIQQKLVNPEIGRRLGTAPAGQTA